MTAPTASPAPGTPTYYEIKRMSPSARLLVTVSANRAAFDTAHRAHLDHLRALTWAEFIDADHPAERPDDLPYKTAWTVVYMQHRFRDSQADLRARRAEQDAKTYRLVGPWDHAREPYLAPKYNPDAFDPCRHSPVPLGRPFRLPKPAPAATLDTIGEVISAAAAERGVDVAPGEVVRLIKGGAPAPTLESDCAVVLAAAGRLGPGCKRRRLAATLPNAPKWAERSADGSTRLDRALATLTAAGRLTLRPAPRGSVLVDLATAA